MKLTRDRVQSIGWVAILTVCFALTMALTLRVNAVKSQVRLAERQILSLQQQKTMLETEFMTRSNQQQLRTLNDVEFGYQAPTAAQYLEGERQLAVLAKPRAPNAPSPIRVAHAAIEDDSVFPAMVSPISGKAMAAEVRKAAAERKPATAARLADRLSQVDRAAVQQ